MYVRWPCAMLDALRHLFNSSEKWKLSDSGSQGRLQGIVGYTEFIRRAIDTVGRQIGSSMQELWERPGPGSRDRQQSWAHITEVGSFLTPFWGWGCLHSTSQQSDSLIPRQGAEKGCGAGRVATDTWVHECSLPQVRGLAFESLLASDSHGSQ